MNNSLKKIVENNPTVKIEKVKDFHTIENLWEDDSIGFKIDKGKRTTVLTKIKFPPEIIGLYHFEDNKLEFIFSPRLKTDPIIKKKFTFNYQGESYKCHFDTCSKSVEFLAKNLRIIKPDTDSEHRNLRDFRSYFNNKGPTYIQQYNKDRVPISFFVEGNFKKFKGQFTPLLKTLNFYMSYFERSHPKIVLLNNEKETEEIKRPCISKEKSFPKTINAKKINETILDIFEVANSTRDLRLRFIFYFQIIEYCTYYFLETDVSNKLEKILSQPDIADNTSEYSKRVQDLLQNHFYKNKTDSNKLESSISFFIEINDIKDELLTNTDFFCKDLKFDGGLTVKKIFDNKEQAKHINNSTLKSVKENIEKIRNTVVHLRHSRENKVILPTAKNNELIKPYLYLVRRIAEKIALQFE